MKKGKTTPPHCSFCGGSEEDVDILISGLEAQICDACAERALEMVDHHLGSDHRRREPKSFASGSKSFSGAINLVPPRELKVFLDKYIIGQDEAKKVLSVAVYNHYKRIKQREAGKKLDGDVEIEKSNVLFVGQTGTGKTLMARTIARTLNVPFTIVDATVFTEAGYVGEDIESILARLLQVCDYDVAAAERGIVYIDEVDKIARKQDNPSITRDVSGEGVQQGLLKMLEGAELLVPPQGGRKHPDQKMLKVNTQNILFICGGAFDGIEKIIARRVNTSVIGYSNQQLEKVDRENLLQYVTHQDIKTFGLIPELVGRLPVIVHLDPLDVETLRLILTEPRNALLKQYQALFAMEDIELILTDDCVSFIAEKALEYKLGARGLRSLCEAILTDAMYDPSPHLNKKQLVIDQRYAADKLDRSRLSKLSVAG